MELQKAIEQLEKSNQIAFLLPEEPNLDALVSAEALLRVLTGRGKSAGLLTPLKSETIPEKTNLRFVAAPPTLMREMIISINTAISPVSQLRYENQEGRVDIILSPKNAPVQEHAISYRKGSVQCDTIVTMGIGDIHAINAAAIDAPPNFLAEVPIINLDISPDNKQYGSINLIDPTLSSISEIAAALIADMPGSSLSRDTATLLLAGLLQQTDGFRNHVTKPTTLLTASQLISAGADHQEAVAMSTPPKSLSFLQLAGRAAVRSKTDPERSIMWSFITTEDFAKTGRTPKDVIPVLSYLEKEFPPHRLNVLLWQEPLNDAIRAIMIGQRDVLNAISPRIPSAFRSPHLEIQLSFQAFPEAEAKLTSLLSEVL